MKRIAILVMFLMIFAATATIAQEAQETPMYVSLTYVSVKAGMNQAFMAAVADHLEWHKSTNDTHYYNVSQVMSGPRTGQMAFAAGPMTGAQLDDYIAFGATDMADWSARGGFNYADGMETIILRTLPRFGNPPPPGEEFPMVHAFELDLRHGRIDAFMEALGKLDEAEKAAGPSDDYSVWVAPASGGSLATRWVVTWSEGWASQSDPNPERQAKVMEAAGGEEAFQEIVGALMGAVASSNITTYMNLPDLSFRPDGQ